VQLRGVLVHRQILESMHGIASGTDYWHVTGVACLQWTPLVMGHSLCLRIWQILCSAARPQSACIVSSAVRALCTTCWGMLHYRCTLPIGTDSKTDAIQNCMCLGHLW
jgi:hypothetical protein